MGRERSRVARKGEPVSAQPQESARLDGLISFFGSHHAIRADAVLRRDGLTSKLVPGPKELSPNCGVAVRFAYVQKERALALLAEKKVQIEDVHPYSPRTDGWPSR
jgi:Putative Se/S carrier protein-like